MKEWTNQFALLKWFVGLNGQAKAVIALLCLAIMFLIYRNYSLGEDIAKERIRYDNLSDKYNSNTKDCKEVQDSLNMVWFQKYDDYRTKREEELKEITKEWQGKYNSLSKKINEYENNR